jgi:hypothetical protein
MPLSAAEQAQVERYGAEDLLGSPSLTPDQRRELEILADEEEESDDEDEVDEIPANQAMRRLRGATDVNELPAWLGKTIQEDAMTLDYCEDDMLDAAGAVLAELDAVGQLPAVRQSITRLTNDVYRQQGSTRHLRGEISSVQKSLRQAYLSERSNRRGIVAVAQAVDKLCKGLMRLGHEKPSPLTKAVASFLPPHATMAKAQQVTAWVYRSFGPRGGQQIAYDRALCARLRLTKSLSPDEEQRWRDFGRLPDHVNVQAPRPQAHVIAEQDRQMRIASMLASLNVSPLALQGLALRRA